MLVFDKDNQHQLTIYDKATGSSKYANLTNLRGRPSIALYDPSTPGQVDVYPFPVATTTLSFYYSVVPADMVNDTDVPWNGAFPEHHDVIALRAAMLLLEADFADTSKVGWMRNRYNVELGRLMASVESAPVVYPETFDWRYDV